MLPAIFSATGWFTMIGLLSFFRSLFQLLSLLWLYLKPSGVGRYLHGTDEEPAWALVTGASGGIEKNLAFELASLGFNVLLHGRSTAKLKLIELELVWAFPNRAFRILVVDAAQCFNAASGTKVFNGLLAQTKDIKLTLVVNNAGGSTERTIGTLESLSTDRLITDASVNALFPTLYSQGSFGSMSYFMRLITGI